MDDESRKKDNRNLLNVGEAVNEYEIKRLIGQGGYGDIYEVSIEGRDDEVTYAMKVEQASCPTQSLKIEQHILEALKGSVFFPRLRGFGFKTHFRYLVIDLFGPSVSNTRREMSFRHYSMSTTLRLGVYMVQCIEDFHKHGYVHCDIKPGNFLLRQQPERCPIVLIDYGLSRQFIDPKTNEPFPERNDCGFVGTSKYASLHIHDGSDPCPRDDIVSWCYSLVEMAGGKLPWRLTDEGEIKKVYKLKKTMLLEKIFAGLPPQIIAIYKYAMGLKYFEMVNFEIIYFLMNQAFEDLEIREKDAYDWEALDEECVKKLSAGLDLPKAENNILFPNGVNEKVEIPDNFDEQEGGCCSIE